MTCLAHTTAALRCKLCPAWAQTAPNGCQTTAQWGMTESRGCLGALQAGEGNGAVEFLLYLLCFNLILNLLQYESATHGGVWSLIITYFHVFSFGEQRVFSTL